MYCFSMIRTDAHLPRFYLAYLLARYFANTAMVDPIY